MVSGLNELIDWVHIVVFGLLLVVIYLIVFRYYQWVDYNQKKAAFYAAKDYLFELEVLKEILSEASRQYKYIFLGLDDLVRGEDRLRGRLYILDDVLDSGFPKCVRKLVLSRKSLGFWGLLLTSKYEALHAVILSGASDIRVSLLAMQSCFHRYLSGSGSRGELEEMKRSLDDAMSAIADLLENYYDVRFNEIFVLDEGRIWIKKWE